MKKLLSLLLALVMVLSLVPATAFAAEIVDSGRGWNVNWVLTNDGTLTISGSGYMDARTELDAPWMEYYEEVRKVIICEGVLSIEDYAFCMFENLTSITIPEGLEAIGRSALGGCVSLTSIHIPASVEKIGYAALAGCGLTAFTVAGDNPNYATIDGVLVNKEKTELIQVPGGRTGSYEIPACIQTIFRYTFTDCHKLTEVIFPDHLTELPEAVLYGLESLTAVKLPASLIEIPTAAFYNCTKLASIEIPNGVTAIGFDAFCGCASLKTVVIPASVESLDTQAFADCVSLTDVIFRGNAPAIDSESGIFCDDTLTAWYPAGDESWTDEIMQDYYGNVTWKSWGVLPLVDVLPFQFWYEPVSWAVENNVTAGISATEFGSTADCNRAQVVTFLWRAAGCPEPTSAENPFVDVKDGDFFYKAVLWAVENNITNGVDATHFGPFTYCNRAQVVTFLYRAMQNPEIAGGDCPFTDVQAGQWYENAILWAVENGVTNGLSSDNFGVDTVCNRAQVVTFLYRTYVN